MPHWVLKRVGCLLRFIQVLILWRFSCIAMKIENLFGEDDNDIDAAAMQWDTNRHLLLWSESMTQTTPHLAYQA